MSRWTLPARDKSATSGVVAGAASAPAGRLGDFEGGSSHSGQIFFATCANGFGGSDRLRVELLDLSAHSG